LTAALPKFLGAANAYPSSRAGIAARYEAARILMALGRPVEAAAQYAQVGERDPRGIYGRMAKLGLAGTQLELKQYDRAIATYQDFVTRKDGNVPTDALLMQLGRAYMLAGRKTEAQQTFTRLVDEYPESPYLQDAKRALDELKARA
jgi:outer membrane protein assembly factor BamD (BamD/ComL family)